MTRPTYTGLPATWNYGQTKTLAYTVGKTSPDASCYGVLMDLGFSTHGVHSAYSCCFDCAEGEANSWLAMLVDIEWSASQPHAQEVQQLLLGLRMLQVRVCPP